MWLSALLVFLKVLFVCNVFPQCCDGACPPCEQNCGKTLGCRNHKCPSRCHRGKHPDLLSEKSGGVMEEI